MTAKKQTLASLRAKVAWRDKRIAKLTEENEAARAALQEAVRVAKHLQAANAMLQNNAKLKTRDDRAPEQLREAEHALMLVKAAAEYTRDILGSYEHRVRHKLPHRRVMTV